MNINAKSIEGLKLISEGLSILIKSLEDTQKSEVAIKPEKTEKTEKKSAKKTKEAVEETEEVEITEEELNGMSYNELKKLAKELGVPAVGGRKELVNRILNSSTEEEEDDEDAPEVEEEEELEETVEDDETDDEEDDEESDDEEEDEDESEDDEEDLTAKVEALVEDMDDDEIRELLESVDIPSKGKRQALIDKLVHAFEDGLIDLEDDDYEDEDETEEAEDETEDESEEESADVTANMSKKRKKAYDEYCEETTESFEEGEITRDDIIEFINDFNGTNDKMKKVSDEDLLAQYLELSAMLIDDDGNIVEEGAYYINDEPYCCGKPLTFNKKKNCYICDVCGSSYDAE